MENCKEHPRRRPKECLTLPIKIKHENLNPEQEKLLNKILKGINNVSPEELINVEKLKPKTRAECQHNIRPCPFVSCRFNFFLDVNPGNGSIKFNYPDKQLWELPCTCVLDAIDKGPLTLEEIGSILNVTRERVRQIEIDALKKMGLTDRQIGLLYYLHLTNRENGNPKRKNF